MTETEFHGDQLKRIADALERIADLMTEEAEGRKAMPPGAHVYVPVGPDDPDYMPPRTVGKAPVVK